MVMTFARRALPKPFAVLLATVLALYFVPLVASPAHAAVPAFEIDGNLAQDSPDAIDWESLQGNPDLFVQNDNGTAIGDATVFSTSSKENDEIAGENTPEQWSKGSPNTAPPKTDVGNYYKYIRTADSGDIELFFAWDRLSPSGTDYYYLELNKLGNTTTGEPGTADYYSVPNRSEGDIRFTLHELGNGELVLLGIDEWDGDKWVAQPLDTSGFDGAVNAENIDPVGFDSPAIAKNGPDKGTIPADQFFETYFNLTDLIGLEPSCPPAFGTLNFRTATGESAEVTGDNLKDYLEPIPLDAPNTCGSLSIFKEDQDGEALGGAIFEISPNPLPDGVEGSDLDTLIIYDDSDDNTDVEVTPDVAVDTNYDDPTAAAGEISLALVEPGAYTVTELAAPDGYLIDDASGSVDVPSEGTDSVTFTNTRETGALRITKIADFPGMFSFDVDCTDNRFDQSNLLISVGANQLGQPGVSAPRIQHIPTGVVCTVTEDSNPLFSTTVTPGNGEVTIGNGTSTVTFSNTRLFGRITVTKNIVGAPNGASTTFTFTVDCPDTAYDQTLTINVGSGTSGSATTGLIPTGLSCKVTEAATPDWNHTSVVPANGTVSVPGTVTFTNTRKQGVLNVSKAVSPVAGNGVVVEFGDTLTYTLTVSATGEATQHGVVVTDYIPGYDPARPTSGKTTYVAGSAKCAGTVTTPCTVTGPDSAHQLTWSLGDMAPGTTRQVTFQVTIDDVKGDPGEVVAVDILNAGAVQSRETPKKPSNQVITPVTKVFPVKASKPPAVLPHTGARVSPGLLAGSAVLLLGLGLLLQAASRRRTAGGHRR
jgi:uncharacterized repeat protein (TIGR01451 family)